MCISVPEHMFLLATFKQKKKPKEQKSRIPVTVSLRTLPWDLGELCSVTESQHGGDWKGPLEIA